MDDAPADRELEPDLPLPTDSGTRLPPSDLFALPNRTTQAMPPTGAIPTASLHWARVQDPYNLPPLVWYQALSYRRRLRIFTRLLERLRASQTSTQALMEGITQLTALVCSQRQAPNPPDLIRQSISDSCTRCLTTPFFAPFSTAQGLIVRVVNVPRRINHDDVAWAIPAPKASDATLSRV
ncbi:hypothetical protein PI125_g16572 [Phytophthora idaei]|nr:hypothetical protein PI125_g16572 [Phytophthora idaei]